MTTIAILGAGASGLTATAAALEEGLLPTVFEKSQRIGGVWAPDKRDSLDHGSAWPGMKVNISRHTGTFSNFSWPESAADFPTTQEVYHYLCRYAQHFNLIPHIRFGCRVMSVVRQKSKWLIRWLEKDNVIQEAFFDAVIVATSKYNTPYVPDFAGIENIQNKMLHSSKYFAAKEFTDQKILVVGGSLSGTSIAEEVAKQTQVIHLIRKERWMLQRYLSTDPQHNGPYLPRDLLKTYSNPHIFQSSEEKYQFFLQHCHAQNSIPEWHMSPQSPLGFVIAENYLTEVAARTLTAVRGEIQYFTHDRVILMNGLHINFDRVIFCTGYTREFNFLPDYLQSKAILYLDTFPTNENQIAFIGMYANARGAVFPLAELQARSACAVLSGRVNLPPLAEMQETIQTATQEMDEIAFTNALGKLLDILPNMTLLNARTRELLLHGAFVPARFRLTGLHSNPALAIEMLEDTERRRIKLLTATS